MSLISNVLLLVTSFREDEKEVILHGYDFPGELLIRLQSMPSKLVTVSPHGNTSITDPDLEFVHVCNRGWMWRTMLRELYPAPPFLLTNDETYRCIYEGPVVTHPSDSTWVRAMQAEHGTFEMPVLTSDWIGELTIESDTENRGHLLAFSNMVDRLPIRCEEIVMLEWDEKFGAVTLDP
jgi:hypothetical protein